MRTLLRLIATWCMLLCLGCPAFAQNKYSDSTRVATLKEWLKRSWIGGQLQLTRIEKDSSGANVQLQIADSLSFQKSWMTMKSAFENQSPRRFEAYLIGKFAFLLDTSPAALRITIGNKPPIYEKPCFTRLITYEKGVRVEQKDCRDAIVRTKLAYRSFKPSLSLKRFIQDAFDTSLQKVLDLLYERCQAYYTKKFPKATVYRLVQEDNSVVFRAENLSNEVIVDSWARPGTIERLEFRIDCAPTGKSMYFVVTVNGKFRAAYMSKTEHDMDIDYRTALQQYTERFTDQHLIAWLKD